MFIGYSETFDKLFNEINTLPQKLMGPPAAPFLPEYGIVGLSLTKQNVFTAGIFPDLTKNEKHCRHYYIIGFLVF
jgi:hypothetical protein